jgi:hypothetical protein
MTRDPALRYQRSKYDWENREELPEEREVTL